MNKLVHIIGSYTVPYISGVSYVASPTPIHSEVLNELLMAKVQFNTSVIDVKLIADTWKPEFGVKRYSCPVCMKIIIIIVGYMA